MRIPDQSFLFTSIQRVIGWFSCGAASAVTLELGLQKYGERFLPANCDTTPSEDSDNVRFLTDVERWLGVKILRLRNPKYRTVDEVIEREKYMSGPEGARCTVELKKVPRFGFQLPDDIHLFGFTSDESGRIADFEKNNPELFLEWILRDNGITKQDCYARLMRAGIKLPNMYLNGYPHNNCPGCVKASSAGYWNKIRRDYPAVFQKRCEQSRRLGVRLVTHKGERIFLDELPPNASGRWKDEVISCGPDCGPQVTTPPTIQV